MNTHKYILKTIKKHPLIIGGTLKTHLQLPKEARKGNEGCNELSLIPMISVGIRKKLNIFLYFRVEFLST